MGTPFKSRAHDRPLHAGPPPVDDPDLTEPPPPAFDQVLLHHRFHIAGMKGVEIDHLLDRELEDVAHRMRLAPLVLGLLAGAGAPLPIMIPLAALSPHLEPHPLTEHDGPAA